MTRYPKSSGLTVAFSSRALFQLETEHRIFTEQNLPGFARYQIEHSQDILVPGIGFPLAKALQGWNKTLHDEHVQLAVISRNHPHIVGRFFNSLGHYDLKIDLGAFVGGADIVPFLHAYKVDLFCSADAADVKRALKNGTAAALVHGAPDGVEEDPHQVRIAFDGDWVVFSGDSDRIFKDGGHEAFEKHEHENRNASLREGPFGALVKKLGEIKRRLPEAHRNALRLSIVTSRNLFVAERVFRTLFEWGIEMDEVHCVGDLEKEEMLRLINPHIFFDDTLRHVVGARKYVPAAHVPIIEESAAEGPHA